MYRAARLSPHHFLECIVLQQLGLADLAQRSQRALLITLREVQQVAPASKKCISRQEHQLYARLELVVRLLLRLLVLRRTAMQVATRPLLSVLQL
jgi:hypothetical protein